MLSNLTYREPIDAENYASAIALPLNRPPVYRAGRQGGVYQLDLRPAP